MLSLIIKKAFDLVNRTLLWQSLLKYELNGKLFRIIFNMYDTAKSCIKLGNKLSDFFSCNIGVRQGENLSPLLFALFLNNFNTTISQHYNGLQILSTNKFYDINIDVQLKLFSLLYADDTIVLAESELELQSALNAVHEYCTKMCLTVNTSKTKIMIFFTW